MRNFREKLVVLGEIIEHRVIERRTKTEQKVKNPSLFAMMIVDGSLICKWITNCSDKERASALGKITVKGEGFTAEDWDVMGK